MSKIKPYLSCQWVILSIVLLMAGCTGSTQKGETFQTGYFDMQGFIAQQVGKLANSNPQVEKVAYLNGKTEHHEQQYDSLQWVTELHPFLDADINKPAFVKQFQVDTLKVSDTVSCISYQAIDDKPRTRLLKLYFHPNDSVPFELEAWLKSNKLFYHSYEYLRLTPSQSYEVRGGQSIMLFGKDSFAIQARFAGK